MPAQQENQWHSLDASEAVRALDSHDHRGLTAAEADARLARDGPNVITTRRGRPWWMRLLLQFHAPLIYILLVASLVTLLLREYTDSAVIFAVVLVNALIGFVEETRAVKAIDALAKSMKMEASVRRDGRRERVDAADLVTGDIVLLEAGDKVPADLRLLTLRELHVDESALTGESKAISKRTEAMDVATVLADRRNMVYAGSLVTRGSGTGLVIAVADDTEVGRISGLIASADELATPLTRKIASFSKLLLWIILAVAALAFLLGIVRGRSPEEMFMASVALAVGAIPEGLPAAVTVMLAVGVARMARRRAIIRKLPAVEALGSTTVICSDKTGTLTQNQMTVRTAWLRAKHDGALFEFGGAGYDPEGTIRAGDDNQSISAKTHPALSDLLRCGVLCNDSTLRLCEHDAPGAPPQWQIHGDPTEGALIVAARKLRDADLSTEALEARWPRIDNIPFESDRQYMATLHANSDDASAPGLLCVKGSVERVLSLCTNALAADGQTVSIEPNTVLAAAARLAGEGLRVLAFAHRAAKPGEATLSPDAVQADASLTFLGLQGMLDPPRAEAIKAVEACQRAGVRVKMITGDHAATAASIAAMIGIDGSGDTAQAPRVITGATMATIPDEQLPDEAEATAVFARMTPEQKLRLVRALQHRGHIVAMTGDGVNDAPALRQADIGVAMGIAGTEAAKDAADMVLADDNFASIEAAVEEGRVVYTNLVKFIVWTLPTNGGEACVILAAIALNSPLPILPLHALYINMITAILLGMPLIFEAKDPSVMSRPPRDPRKPLFTFDMFMRTALVSLLLCIGSMGLFHWELERGESEEAARTAAVSVIIIGEIFYLFSARALLRPAWSVPLFSNMYLWAGIVCMLTIQFAFANLPIMNKLFSSAPLDLQGWSRVFAAGAMVFVVVEAEKAIRRLLLRDSIDDHS